MTPSEAYDEVCRLAREHALISQAAGGVVIIVHPDTQKEAGIYDQIQWMHGKGPHPESAKVHEYEAERAAPVQGELL